MVWIGQVNVRVVGEAKVQLELVAANNVRVGAEE